ncbi:hypothetical protein B9G54_06330 [Alloscardovia macacae]|uniref:exo-alpha-sialidase n=1 Tax=Alloscardovia macacae TaxID=1160091 RepID=A0A1Y2ST10_9BIFI|nr:sialidase family protein [Alloscardovia macacae]OTA25976.1 hypothetical protein B9G54_06330 [Alloscardovia macacae]OTA28743.1 hypothetical protein B9T39_05960 [Alloscardovia macacae]
MTVSDRFVYDDLDDLAGPESSLCIEFSARTDGVLLSALPAASVSPAPFAPAAELSPAASDPAGSTDPADTDPLWQLSIEHGSLVLRAAGRVLDMEDTYGVAFGTPHTLVLTFAAPASPAGFGTRVYLDGYQVFSCTADLRPSASSLLETSAMLTSLTTHPRALAAADVAARYTCPLPGVEFSAAYVSAPDVAAVRALSCGTLHTRMRVRGRGQKGTVLAASTGGREVLSLSVDDAGFLYRVCVRGTWEEFRAEGFWTDGNFHDVVVRAFRGAIDIYVDGFLALHQPGQHFFAEAGSAAEDIDAIWIGQNSTGERLFGEVRNGGIYTYPLTDGQIAALAHREPLTTTALFDSGYEGSASYRIPSLVTTSSGVLIAGADQRLVNSNDTPNEIHFVIRRSLDGGQSWQPLQTVIAYPSGPDGPSVDGPSTIDSCMVVDTLSKEHPGRITVLVDHFPGGVGFANATKERGTDDAGRLLLEDRDGSRCALNPDGSVDGHLEYHVDPDGFVTKNGAPAGNIHWKQGLDPAESLLTLCTSFLVEVHSDDDGATWSQPRYIDWMVREDWMKFLGTGPGCGIQLHHGPHAGRLLIPYYCCGENPVMNASGMLISDDGGETWRRGQCVFESDVDISNFEDNRFVSSESTCVELADGSVLTFFRNQHPSGRIGTAISHDGGETWQNASFDVAVPDIFSQPNALSLGGDRVLFANASLMRPYRGCGVLRLSEDGGRTWARSRCVQPYHYVYQCMALRPDGDIGLLWERETAGVYYTRVPRGWFE